MYSILYRRGGGKTGDQKSSLGRDGPKKGQNSSFIYQINKSDALTYVYISRRHVPNCPK